MSRLKITTALLLMLILLCGMAGQAETVYFAFGEPYYHKNASCEFGTFTMSDDNARYQLECDKDFAVSCDCRVCPSCASAFKPYFTGKGTTWIHEVKPWDFGGPDTYVDQSIRDKWGDPSGRINEMYPDIYIGYHTYPSNYAGIFRNACGGYTLLMVKPTAAKCKSWSKALKSDFWVIEAKYSLNQLNTLYDYALRELLSLNVHGVNSVGIAVDANRVTIGTPDVSIKNQALILADIVSKGYPSDAVMIVYSSAATTWDF